MLQGRPGSILGAILGAKWEAKGAKMPPKIDLKIYEIWNIFFDRISIAKMKAKMSTNASQHDAKMHEENHVIFY